MSRASCSKGCVCAATLQAAFLVLLSEAVVRYLLLMTHAVLLLYYIHCKQVMTSLRKALSV
jgi:hypothetical protein